MKKNKKILFILAFLQGMVFYASISTLYRQAAHLSLREIGIIEAISLFLSLSFEIPWGVLADRFGYKKTMIICNSLYFLSKVVFYYADSFLSFLFERVLLSLALAGISGVDTAMLYLSCDKEESQKVFGIYYNLGNMGLIFSSLIYSLFFKGNFRLAAWATCVPYFIAMLLSFFLEEVKHEPLEHSLKELFKMIFSTLKEKNTVLLLIGAGLFTEAIREVTTFLNQLLYVESSVSNELFGFIHAGMICIGFLSLFSDSFTHRVGRKKFLQLITILSLGSCLTIYQFKIGWCCIVSIAVLEGISALFYPLLQTIQNERVIVFQRATQLSVFMILMELIQMVVDITIFEAAERNLGYSVILSFLLCLIGGILIIKNAGSEHLKNDRNV